VAYPQNSCSFIGVLQETVSKHRGGKIWKVLCIVQPIWDGIIEKIEHHLASYKMMYLSKVEGLF
jgi:hypothetical protein